MQYENFIYKKNKIKTINNLNNEQKLNINIKNIKK